MIRGGITHRTFEHILGELTSIPCRQREILGGLKLQVPEDTEHDEFNWH